MRILIVDKDLPFAIKVANELANLGHKPYFFDCFSKGYQASLQGDHDLLLINVNSVGDEGSCFVEKFSKRHTTPVIVTSSNGEIYAKIHHLKIGADDYIVKPVATEELMARISLQLRKRIRHSIPNSTLVFGDLIIHLSKNCVERNGISITLTKQEFSTLLYLVRRQGELVTRDELFKNIWGKSSLRRSNLVNVAIRRLRQKIDEPFDKKFLYTVHGIGYIAEYRD